MEELEIGVRGKMSYGALARLPVGAEALMDARMISMYAGGAFWHLLMCFSAGLCRKRIP